ncbi:MAG: 3'-5' exonuclease [Nitrospirae bacterium]|nr:MAG: 3'-5' exonuclease [Nitrospirota bacterium]
MIRGLFTRFLTVPRADRELPVSLRMQSGLKKRLDRKTSILEADYVVFDTELTGLDMKKDSLISIGAVKMKGSQIFPGKTFYSLVRPQCELKAEGIMVHEITHDDLESAVAPPDALNDFVSFVGDSILVGHFSFIDLNFVNKALKQCYGIKIQNPCVDTFELHEWLYENDSSFARHHQGMTVQKDLFSMAKTYGITVKTAHNALIDAYLTAQLFQRFLRFLPEAGIKTVGELLQVGKS